MDEVYDENLQHAEESLVSCAFVDPTVRDMAQVEAEMFFSAPLREIWAAMGELDGNIETTTVCEQLGGSLEAVGGLAYVSGLELKVFTAENYDNYANLIRDRYLSRQVQSKCSEILERSNSLSGEDLLTELSDAGHSLTASLGRPRRTLDDVVAQVYQEAIQPTGGGLGVPTGIGIERWIPGGLPKSKITTIFADTGSFKTTLVNQMMFHMAENGYRGILFPLEDSDELNAQRYLSRKSGVPYGRIAGGVLDNAERQKIENVTPGQWEALKRIVSLDGIEPRADKIVREVATAKARTGLDFVVVDYLQLLEGRSWDQKVVLTEAMRKFANAAKRYELCWINISQANEKSRDRGDPRPSLRDMFGSASMKQMSKTVLALWRPYEEWEDPSTDSKADPMYKRLFEQRPNVADKMYQRIVELWMLKNVLGRKKAMMQLIVKPELGIMDPVPQGAIA